MTKTRSQMKGKSLLSEIPTFPKRTANAKKQKKKAKEATKAKEALTKPKTDAKKPQKATRKRHLPYSRMIRESVTSLSATSSSSKAVSGHAITRYLASHFGVEIVNEPHLRRVLQQGVDAGALRKVKNSFLLTSKQTDFGVGKSRKAIEPPKSTPQPPTKRAKKSPKRATPKRATPKRITPSPVVTAAPVYTPAPVYAAPPVVYSKITSGQFSTLAEEVPVGRVGEVVSGSAGGSGGLNLTVDIEKNMLGCNKEALMAGIASVEARKGGAGQRPPCDIVAVVDRSGSMCGGKLELVKQALCYLVTQLGDEDRLSVVSFDHEVHDVFGLRCCTDDGKKTMTSYINGHPKMQTGGMTNIRLGLELGMTFLKKRAFQNPVTAVMLLTDGQGGAPDTPTLQRWDKEVGGVPIHCFGFGANHDARTLANISDHAHGSFTFVENINTVGGAFATCLGGVLSVTAQQVVMRIETEVEWAKIQEVHTTYSVSVSADGKRAEVTIPDTISEEKKDVVIFLKVGMGPQDYDGPLFSCGGTYLNVRSETGRGSTETMAGVVCQLARPVDDSAMTFSMRVDQEKNRIQVAEALKEAVRLGEAKNLGDAQRCLEFALQRLQSSPSGATMPHLAQDLHNARARFESQSTYQQQGYAFARQQEQSHRRQRAMGPEPTYCNPEQMAQRAANAAFHS